MAKLILDDLASLQSEPSALQTLASNNRRIEAAVEDALSRSGKQPNEMDAPLDLNGQRILNIGAPINGTDVARLSDVQNALAVEMALIPALASDALLSNDGTMLVWRNPADIPGMGDMKKSDNLSGLADVTVARTNLGLGDSVTYNIGTSGSNIPLLSTANAWSAKQTFQAVDVQAQLRLLGVQEHQIQGDPTVLSEDGIGRRVPRTKVRDSNTPISANDCGDSLVHTSATAHSWTIPLNLAWPGNAQMLILNPGSGVLSVVPDAGVELRRNGGSTSGTATVAQHGCGTLIRVSANKYYLIGPGVS